MKERAFPEGFYWGAATASYQVEGGNENCDWAQAAREGKVPKCGRACDHYNRYEEDFDIAVELGHNCHRISIEWARIEPEEGRFDDAEIEHYRVVLAALRARRLKPFITLWHFTLPQWFADKGGFGHVDAPKLFARYCAYVAKKLGNDCRHFSTLNEPIVFASKGWLVGDWPPFKKWPGMGTLKGVPPQRDFEGQEVSWKNLFRYFKVRRNLAHAHNLAYKEMKKVAFGIEVGLVHQIVLFHADGRLWNKFLAAIMNWHWTHSFIRRVYRHCDSIGVNYYLHKKFGDTATYEKTDMGWDVYPEGLCDALLMLRRYNRPLWVSEAGIADASDHIRADYITRLIRCMHAAMQKKTDVLFFDVAPLTVTWGTWWAGSLLSLLAVGAFLIRWISKPTFHPRTRQQIGEAVVVFVVLGIITVPLFWFTRAQVGGISLVYFMLIPMFWAALRLGPRLTTLALFLVTVNAIAGMLYGANTIPPEQLGVRIFNMEVFLNIIAVIFFILVGIEEERKSINKTLRSHVSRLEDALAQLSAQNRAKSDFLAVLAHELRNPLAPLLSTVELLTLKRESAGDPEEHKMLGAAYDRIRTMGHLLDDLLDMSRITQTAFELHLENIELRPAIERALEIAEPLMQVRRHSVSVHLPQETICVRADPVRFEQMLVNLLTNAAKYTNDEGSIEIIGKPYRGVFALTVRDNGIGIEPTMLDQVFEPFRQVPSKRTAGLGIGLSVVKKLAEMHNGTITATSHGLGKGSAFTLTLPMTPSPARQKTSLRPSPEKEPTSAFKVLVVDDNEEAARGLGKLLTLRGHDVSLAYAGADALEAARRYMPNIILLDIGLPDMDGYEVARSLRDEETSSALIALTGYGQDEDKQRAKDAGFDFHLTKPVGLADIEGVFARIEKIA